MLQAALSECQFLYLLPFQPFSQTTPDAAGAVVAEQTRLMVRDGLVAPRGRLRQFNSICHVFSPHVFAELPGNDVAAVDIQDGAEIMPAPADDLQVSEIGLPHLVNGGGVPTPRTATVRPLPGGVMFS